MLDMPTEPSKTTTKQALGPGAFARTLDRLAHTSLLAAAVAGSLTAAAGLAFGLAPEPALLVLASAGTLVVYNIDRLRDIDRDRTLAPRRSDFVMRNRRRVQAIVAGAGLISVAAALLLPPRASAVCALVLGLGLLHRRLKQVRGIKTLYLTLSWLAVVVGLPVAVAVDNRPSAVELYWVGATLGCAILANMMASNLDRKRAVENPDHAATRRRLGPAIATAGLGIAFAIVAPSNFQALGLIAGAEFVALCRFQTTERYVPVVVDGALFTGALLAIAMLVIAPNGVGG